jgi:predicted AAA+ superfamily ATPase
VTHPRFYLFDTGVTNALNRRLTAVPDPAARGRLFEQWIVLECVRMLDYARTEARPYYWRTHMGAEVDLVVEKHGRLLLAAEIKSSARVSGADLSGLRSFADAHPRVPLYVVSEVAEEYRLAGVRVLPYRLFFQELRKRLHKT